MRRFILAVICLVGLFGCMNKNDDSTIDESSIVITRGNIRDVYVEAYADANAKGLKGIDIVLPNKETGYDQIHEMGYTMIYEVYDPQGKLVEKRTQDLGKYGDHSSFSRQELTITQPQWWSEDNPVYYTLILRLKIINQPLSTATRKFRLVKDSTCSPRGQGEDSPYAATRLSHLSAHLASNESDVLTGVNSIVP